MFYVDVERDMIMEGNMCVFISFNLFIMIFPINAEPEWEKELDGLTGGVWRSCWYFTRPIRFHDNGDVGIWGSGWLICWVGEDRMEKEGDELWAMKMEVVSGGGVAGRQPGKYIPGGSYP